MAASLSINRLDAGYGAVSVLHGVTLDVRAGETVALLGTNGNGKSTLMKCVMGMVRPSAGSIEAEIDGSRINLVGMTTPAQAFVILQQATLVLSEDGGDGGNGGDATFRLVEFAPKPSPLDLTGGQPGHDGSVGDPGGVGAGGLGGRITEAHAEDTFGLSYCYLSDDRKGTGPSGGGGNGRTPSMPRTPAKGASPGGPPP